MATKRKQHYTVTFRATFSDKILVEASSCGEAVEKAIREVKNTRAEDLLERYEKPEDVTVTSMSEDVPQKAKATRVG